MLRRRGIATNIVIVAVVVLLAAGTLGVIMLTPQTGTPATQGASSATSPQGLRLTESLNASTITVGQSLNVSVSILNTLPTLNNVLPSSDWSFQGVSVDLWPACYFSLPAEAVVLDGNYSLQELPSAANVTIGYICMEGVHVDHVIFQPDSSQVNLNGIYSEGGNQTLGPFQLALSFTTAGYWNLTSLAGEVNAPIIGQSQTPPPAYTAFSPGVYTIAVDDEWGQAVVMHVTVLPVATSSSSSSTTSSTSSSSSSQPSTTSTTTTTTTSDATGEAPPISGAASANVTMGGFPYEIGVDANTSRIYVSDLFANRLYVLDATTDSVVGTITLPGTSGFGLAVDAQTDMVYVPVTGCTNEENATNSCDAAGANSNAVGIVEIDGATNSIVNEFPIGAERLVVDPATGTLYGVGGEGLLAIDASTGSVIAQASLNGAAALSLAIDTKTDTVYVGACQQLVIACEGAEVLIVNGSTLAVQSTASLDVDALNFPVIVDSQTDMVYTMGLSGNLTLFAINGASGAIEYSSELGGSCGGAGGGDLAMNTLTGQIYASFNSQSLFLVIDAGTGHIVSMLSTENGLNSVAFDPATLQVYVTTESAHANVGFFLALPESIGEGFVNYGLLTGHVCVP